MGWNQGAQGITKLQNAVSIDVDIVKCYGQIDEATLKMHCDVFCKAGGQIFWLEQLKQSYDGAVPQEQSYHCHCGLP
jgi:hypothetical protein